MSQSEGEPVAQQGLFDGDTGTAPPGARRVITHLMMSRILDGTRDPDLWAVLRDHQDIVLTHFHNMYVDLVIAPHAMVAFKRQVDADGQDYRRCVRQRTLTKEATVVMLLARERVQHTVMGEVPVLTREDITQQITAYYPAEETNLAALDKRINGAIDALAGQDLLRLAGAGRWEISPAISLVVTAQAIERFVELITAPADSAGIVDDAEDPDDEEDE